MGDHTRIALTALDRAADVISLSARLTLNNGNNTYRLLRRDHDALTFALRLRCPLCALTSLLHIHLRANC